MNFNDFPEYYSYIKETPSILLFNFESRETEKAEIMKFNISLEENERFILAFSLSPEVKVGENFNLVAPYSSINDYIITDCTLVHATLGMSKQPEKHLYAGHPYLCVFRFNDEVPTMITKIPQRYGKKTGEDNCILTTKRLLDFIEVDSEKWVD